MGGGHPPGARFCDQPGGPDAAAADPFRAPGPGRRAWAFTLGIAATVVLFIALVATIGRGLVLATGNESMTERAIKALAAVGLLALGIRALRRGPRPESHHRRMADAKPLAFVPVGFATMWLNLSSLVLMLPAVHVAVNSSAPADQVTAMLLLIAFCALAPALLPALLVTVMGRQRSDPMLHRLNTFTQAHSSQINAGICFLFAVLLTVSAIRG
ncbi:MAG: GAP family protein [Candidatus Nanopelagicales bacterium]